MTATAELERTALAVIPPVGCTGWRITVEAATQGGSTGYAVVPILGGRVDGRPVFRGSQSDCARMYDLLAGTSTSRRARDLPTAGRPGLSDRALAEKSDDPAGPRTRGSEPATTPDPAQQAVAGASTRLCAGCDQPLPEDGRSDRTTHGGACRIAAFRRRAAENATGADADSGTPDVTPSRANLAGHSRPALEAGPVPASPHAGPRGLSGPTSFPRRLRPPLRPVLNPPRTPVPTVWAPAFRRRHRWGCRRPERPLGSVPCRAQALSIPASLVPHPAGAPDPWRTSRPPSRSSSSRSTRVS